ncbi:hypothetical protein IWX90DRAFT_430743 [Phyllosticta citrichinensis]|uniref:ATP-grasp domain-containing protein n=1 Tax=Phyllosticta citrichinensis TaxID=1130410 RepID=A0ABR1XWV7_9PEZI
MRHPVTASSLRLFSSQMKPRLAVLYQALDPPVLNGVQKPKKPNGYVDSCADIAYTVSRSGGFAVATPAATPDPAKDVDWSFGDDEAGILDAVRAGATHLWANTVLFKEHPLQTSAALDAHQDDVRVVGQPPLLAETYDDKALVNHILKEQRRFTIPVSCLANAGDDLAAVLEREKMSGRPVIAKPVRGRGSHGVKLCQSLDELARHVQSLWKESPSVILEEYLAGQEATVTVMPPSAERPTYWAMPIVTRFNHVAGIAPYSGVVAVTANSRTLTEEEEAADPTYKQASRECAGVAELLKTKAPIRIDVRRFSDEPGSTFALFDINMKPNMTGPGRPGREDQASLCALAASGLGWDYAKLLQEILQSASTLRELRSAKLD